MRTTSAVLSLIAAVGLAACAGARPTPTACQLEFLYKAPDRPFERLGEFSEMVRIIPRGGAQEALRPAACALGADAVVVTRTMVVNVFDHTMVEGYAIKWTVAPPPPPEPEAPAPPARSISL